MNKSILSCKVMCLALSLAALSATAVSAQQAPPAPRVEVVTAAVRTLSPQIQVPGTVISRNDSRLSAEISGRIVWIAEVGDRIDEGDVIARIDDRLLKAALTQAQANVARLEADLGYRRREVERIEELAAQGNTPVSRLDEAVANRDMTSQSLIEARAIMERAAGDLDRASVRAPFPGRVVERLSQIGEYASPGRELVRLVDTTHVEITAQAPVSSSPYLSDGLTVMVSSGDEALESDIRSVIPVGDVVSRMMEVRVNMPTDQWVIGSPVKVSLPSSDPKDVVSVPRDALILRSNNIYVFRVGEGNVAERLDIRTGAASGDYIEVIGGIQPGDQVIVRGGERLNPGQQVEIAAQS